MLIIGPGALLLIILLMFKPVRFLVGMLLFAVLASVVIFILFYAHPGHSQVMPHGPVVPCAVNGYVYNLPDFTGMVLQSREPQNAPPGSRDPWGCASCPECRPSAHCAGGRPR